MYISVAKQLWIAAVNKDHKVIPVKKKDFDKMPKRWREMELFLQLSGLGLKIFFYKVFPLYSKEIKIYLQTGNGIIQTGNGIISPSSCHL